MDNSLDRPHWHKFLPLLLVLAGLLAYHNSFSGPFIFDDEINIVDNTRLRHLARPWTILMGTLRPVVDLSFAVNYALGGLNVWGYHLINLVVHLLAALTLFGVVRRSLLSPSLRDRYEARAPWLVLTVAMLWVVHPLLTQSVVFIVHRGESMMSLFYLLTVYCVNRGLNNQRSRGWFVGAILSCALGMGCKPVMTTAPLMVLLYDRVLYSGSFRETFRLRRGLYLGLAATWGLLILLIANTPNVAQGASGLEAIHPLHYALTQFGVVLRYLKLSVWPHPLLIDYYDWPIAKSLKDVGPSSLIMGGLFLMMLVATKRFPRMGFLGIGFILLLLPTSSFFPLADVAFEQRMYLPLVAVIAVLVLLGDALQHRLIKVKAVRQVLMTTLVLAAVSALGWSTVGRNEVYSSEVSVWSDMILKRPNSARAHHNLGVALIRLGKVDEAIAQYTKTIALDPDYAEAYNNLGVALAKQERYQEAIVQYAESLRRRPRRAATHNNLGMTLFYQGKVSEAISRFVTAIELKPDLADAHNNLGLALYDQGQVREAAEQYQEAILLKPEYADAHNNMGLLLVDQGHLADAIDHYAKALRSEPNHREVHNNLGIALAQLGKVPEAIHHYQTALLIEPRYAQAHNNLGNALAQLGRNDQAITHFEEALRLDPNYAKAHSNLGIIYAKEGKSAEAIDRFSKALAIQPNYAMAHNNWGVVLLQQGQVDEAIAHFNEALRIDPEYVSAHNNLGIALRQREKLPEQKP